MDLGDSLLGSSLANKKPLRLGRGLMQMLLIAICSSLFGGFLGGFFRDLLGWLGSGGDRCGYLLGGGFLLAEDTSSSSTRGLFRFARLVRSSFSLLVKSKHHRIGLTQPGRHTTRAL
jgi:hypothetical protein